MIAAIASRPSGLERCAPLGVPVGARGEDHEARLVRRRLQVGVVVGGDQRVERRLPGRSPSVQPTTRCDALVDPVEQAGELLVVDERLRPLAPRHLDQLRAGEHRVEVERAGAELGRGQRRLDEAAVVAAHDPDPVAGADPHLGEGVGEGVGAAVDLLEGERAAFVDRWRSRAGSGSPRWRPRWPARRPSGGRWRRSSPALSGRIRPRIPASCSTLTSKAASETDWRTLVAMELSIPMAREAYSLSTKATAMQAIPSPRPIQPIPSLVVALTLTRAEVASARMRSISLAVGTEPRLLADRRSRRR